MTPQAAYLQTLGLETLDARYQRQAGNALQLAKALRELGAIRQVNYIGLEDNPYHELAQRQFGKTAGAMLTIDLEEQGGVFPFPQPPDTHPPCYQSLRQPHAGDSPGKYHLRTLPRGAVEEDGCATDNHPPVSRTGGSRRFIRGYPTSIRR